MFRMTKQDYLELTDSYGGICLACGEIQYDGVEPDAEGYTCEYCGKNGVVGVDQALILDVLEIVD